MPTLFSLFARVLAQVSVHPILEVGGRAPASSRGSCREGAYEWVKTEGERKAGRQGPSAISLAKYFLPHPTLEMGSAGASESHKP